jgi:predicted O-methyltransferase YrrM
MLLPFDAIPTADFIRSLSRDIIPTHVRRRQEALKVPSLGKLGCQIISICAAMASPQTIIDIGCGIGISTMALHIGAPTAQIYAVDANSERAAECHNLMQNVSNVTVVNDTAVSFLQNNDITYDMAFVDSVKKNYGEIWHFLRQKLNTKAVVIFDDVLLHGYVAEENATVPLKYRYGATELRTFLQEIANDATVKSQIIPIDGGMLLVVLQG